MRLVVDFEGKYLSVEVAEDDTDDRVEAREKEKLVLPFGFVLPDGTTVEVESDDENEEDAPVDGG